GGAEAALLGVGGDEGGRDGVEPVALGERLGGADGLALGLEREHGAGVDGLAVDQDGAGAASAAVADALAAGDVHEVAQGVEQGDARLDVLLDLAVVDGEGEADGAGAHGGGAVVLLGLLFLLLGGGGGGERLLAQRRRGGGDAGAAQEVTARQG